MVNFIGLETCFAALVRTIRCQIERSLRTDAAIDGMKAAVIICNPHHIGPESCAAATA
jgi:hypothetical protein